MTSTIQQARDIASIEHDIPNNTTGYDYAYPSGYSGSNCMFIGAKCFTKYDSWVDMSYSNFGYFGSVMLNENNFSYTPTNAGNSKRIRFMFAKI